MASVSKYTKNELEVLKETSRTFYIPIVKLVEGVKEAVASAYLCLRAIDEIEDHPTIPNDVKARMLREVSLICTTYSADSTVESLTPAYETEKEHRDLLPEVSIRIGEWIMYAPASIRGRIVDATSGMSDRMATWAERNWKCETERDLDAYTFAVAGAVGLLLSDIWAWWDGTKTDRDLAIGFGRGLQSVNILRNKDEDAERGVTFYPKGWTVDDMQAYATRNLAAATRYIKDLKAGSPALIFCRIPYNLAVATCNTLKSGKEKLSREEVVKICEKTDLLEDKNAPSAPATAITK